MTALSAEINVVVPTFRERENLPELLQRLSALRDTQCPGLNVTIVDDNSADGSEEYVREHQVDWLRLIVRTDARGLSSAVIRGINETSGEVIVVMDADLSHPPERIPEMLNELDRGADFVVGSRYVEGGGTTDDWGVLRWLNSRVATVLARPFTKINDPMSGFFALKRQTYDLSTHLNPIGYKVGLELIVKCGCRQVTEIPICFANRTRGESKLTLKEQLRYIQHLRRLALYKFRTPSEIIQFAVVGSAGAVVNLSILTLMLHWNVPTRVAVAGAIFVSIISNFALNRRFTFSYSKAGHLPSQFFGYLMSTGAGAAVNYSIALSLLHFIPTLLPQIASVAGIAIATIFNFLALKFIIFKTKYYVKTRA